MKILPPHGLELFLEALRLPRVFGMLSALTITAVSSVSIMIGQATSSDATGGIVGLTSAGSAGTAVVVLGYMAKAMVDGRLVARQTASIEETLVDIVKELQRVSERQEEREQALVQINSQLLAFVISSSGTKPTPE